MTYSTVKGTQLGAPPACGSSDVTEQRNVAQNVVYLTVFLSPREAGTLELGLNGDLTEAPAWAPEGGGVREGHSESPPHPRPRIALQKFLDVIIVRWSERGRLRLEHLFYMLWKFFILPAKNKNFQNSLIFHLL